MKSRVLALLFLGALCAPASAMTLDTTRVTFGTTFPDGPLFVKIKSALPFTITRTGDWCWHPGLTVQPLGGVGPTTVALTLDKSQARQNEVDHTYLAFTDADGTAVLDVRVSCSGSSGCGQPEGTPSGSRPSCVPAPPQPTNQATVAPPGPTQPPAGATGTPQVAPTPVATAGGPAPGMGNRPVQVPGPVQAMTRPIPYRYLSYKLNFQNPQAYAFVPPFYNAVTATQTSMDAQEESRILATLEVLRAIDDPVKFPDCKNAVEETINVSQGISHIFRDLMGPYQVTGKLNDGASGSWLAVPDDNYYAIVGYSMRRLQKCLVGSKTAVACAKLPVGLLDFLDLRVDALTKQCVMGALFTLPTVPTYQKDVAARGLLTAGLMPAFSAQQCILIRKATALHHQSSLSACGLMPPLPVGSPSANSVLLQAQQTAVNETQSHALQLIPFAAGFDTRWPAREHCAISLYEDLTWGDGASPFSWDGEVCGLSVGNWGVERTHAFSHKLTHTIAAHMWVTKAADGTWVDKSPPYLYRFPCRLNGALTYGDKCPEESQAQVLNRILKGDFGVYGSRAIPLADASDFVPPAHDACGDPTLVQVDPVGEPTPDPRRTRANPRPTATADPAHPKFSIFTNCPVARGTDIALTIVSRDVDTKGRPIIPRGKLWMFAPGQPVLWEHGRPWCSKTMTFIGFDHGHILSKPAKETCHTDAKDVPGTYQVVVHVPAEPGAAFGGLIESITCDLQ